MWKNRMRELALAMRPCIGSCRSSSFTIEEQSEPIRWRLFVYPGKLAYRVGRFDFEINRQKWEKERRKLGIWIHPCTHSVNNLYNILQVTSLALYFVLHALSEYPQKLASAPYRWSSRSNRLGSYRNELTYFFTEASFDKLLFTYLSSQWYFSARPLLVCRSSHRVSHRRSFRRLAQYGASSVAPWREFSSWDFTYRCATRQWVLHFEIRSLTISF